MNTRCNQAAKRQSQVSFQETGAELADKAGGRARASPRRKPASAELTVCDITGDWGRYQWSLCLFALLYSALASQVVVFGPMQTPELEFECAQQDGAGSRWPEVANHSAASDKAAQPARDGASDRCFKWTRDEQTKELKREPCTSFVYKDTGELSLTNSFNLVCERHWLKSLPSCAALIGMLLSSVTLGLVTDKYGRLRCTQLAFAISLPANLCAILTPNYLVFCACVMLMSFAQIGAGNALCTLVMESTSPRFRFVPVFEYGLGWGIGVVLVPWLHSWTLDYRYFMATLFVWQVVMLPWLHWGIFESIRWLLSEGHLNRAQIELRRACRWNRAGREGSARLAQDIANIQVQRIRKASRVIELDSAPRHLARALGTRVDETAHELDALSGAIRDSFFAVEASDRRASEAPAEALTAQQIAAALSPTLTRMSFCVTAGQLDQAASQLTSGAAPAHSPLPPPLPAQTKCTSQLEAIMAGERRHSFTTQSLVQLAMKYSKTVERADQGSFLLVQIFHRKLWRCTLLLAAVFVMYETSYYGFIQANKFVGQSVELNYLVGGLTEWTGAFVSMFMLTFCSRKFSLISTTLTGALVCFSIALTYQLLPPSVHPKGASGAAEGAGALANLQDGSLLTELAERGDRLADSLIDNEANLEPISGLNLIIDEALLENASAHAQGGQPTRLAGANLAHIRETANFYLMIVGKLVIVVGIQVAATISLEVYPNNLRQSGSGAILLVGRLSSIMAPLLFNDPSEDKHVFKLTLFCLAAIGVLVACFIPNNLREFKGVELCDQLDEIGQHDERDERAA